MFEKDEDYRKARKESKDKITKVIKVLSAREETLHDAGFEEGAEFGYNKSNEWHDLRKNPNDTPKTTGDYVTNIGVLTYDHYGNGVYKWHTPFCEACDYSDVVGDDEVIAWCEIPKFKEIEQ